MSTVIDDNTLMRVVALTAAPDFVDVYGSVTGTHNATYKPTFVGERGFMLHSAAAPLDIGVETTGDQLGICFNWTPHEIDQAASAATVFAAGVMGKVKARQEAFPPPPPAPSPPSMLSDII